MSVINPENFTQNFNNDWVEKKTRVVQIGIDDGEITQFNLIPHAINITKGLQGELKKAFVEQDLTTDREFLHITATNADSDKQTETHLLIELDEGVVYEGRQNHLAVITNQELVSFVRPQQ